MSRILSFLTILLFCNCSNSSNPALLEAPAFAEKMKLAGATILDVRRPDEFSTGHLHAAVNMDWNSGHFMDTVKVLDPAKPVLVYCRTGRRSGEAAAHMRTSGFKEVYELKGGIVKWKADGLPVSGGE